MKLKFTYKNYDKIIKKIKLKKKIITFSKYIKLKKIDNFLILRHDIEYFLDSALDLALIESNNKVKSTFFFQTTSKYNIFEEDQYKKVKKIKKLGHEFGIHYDADFLSKNKINLKKSIILMKKKIETFFNLKIKAISCHRPKKFYYDPKIKGVFNVYNKNFLNKVKYISDSQQVFRNDLNYVLDTFNKIHFLIHDYTWSKVGNTWQKNIINNFKKDSLKNLIYFKKVINEWEYGLKQRIKLDKKLMNKFKS